MSIFTTLIKREPLITLISSSALAVFLSSQAILYKKLLAAVVFLVILREAERKVKLLAPLVFALTLLSLPKGVCPTKPLKKGIYRGKVLEARRFWGGSGKILLRLERGVTVEVGCRDLGDVDVGDLVEAWLRPSRIKIYKNPAPFSREKLLLRRGICYKAYIPKGGFIKILKRGSGPVAFIRRRIRRFGKGIKDPFAKELFLSLTLGERGVIKRARMELIRRAGLVHIFAISGLHLVIIFFLFYRLSFKLLSLSERLLEPGYAMDISNLTGLLASLLYALVSGFSTPTKRAFTALSLYTLFSLIGKRRKLLDSVLGALFVILLFFPGEAYSLSFYLSFVATFSIVIAYYHLSRLNISKMKTYLLLNLIPFFSTLPLVVYFFYYIPTYAPLFNALLIPIFAAFTLPGILISAFASFFLPKGIVEPMVVLFSKPFKLFELVRILPFNTIYASSRDSFLVLSGLLLLASLVRRNKKLMALALFLFLLWMAKGPRPGVYVFDGGNGIPVLIVEKGRGYLIDTGSSFGASLSLVQAVKGMGLRRIDTLILSSSFRRSCGGLQKAVELLRPKNILFPSIPLDPSSIEAISRVEKKEKVENLKKVNALEILPEKGFLNIRYHNVCFLSAAYIPSRGCDIVIIPSSRGTNLGKIYPRVVITKRESKKIGKGAERAKAKIFETHQGAVSIKSKENKLVISYMN